MIHNLYKPLLLGLMVLTVSLQAQVAPPVPPKFQAPVINIPDFKMEKEAELAFKLAEAKMKEANLSMKRADKKMKIAGEKFKEMENHLAAEKMHEMTFAFDLPALPPLPECSFSQQTFENDARNSISVEKAKFYTKVYNVDSKDKLNISNQYGKVMVNTWAKNSIEVKVEIKAFEATDAKAQEILNGVSILDSKSADVISFTTKIVRDKLNEGWWGIKKGKDGKVERRGVEVNYIVNMPTKNALSIVNKYGTTILPDFEGIVNVNSTYGSVTAEKLNNPANNIVVKYGAAVLKDFSCGNLNVSYGSLDMKKGDKIDADIGYSQAKIYKLTNSGNLSIKYGNLKIEDIDKNVKTLQVNSSYGDVVLGVDQVANANFDVTVSYGGFNAGGAKVINTPTSTSRTGFQPVKTYSGKLGNGEDSKYVIKAHYGSVKFQ